MLLCYWQHITLKNTGNMKSVSRQKYYFSKEISILIKCSKKNIKSNAVMNNRPISAPQVSKEGFITKFDIFIDWIKTSFFFELWSMNHFMTNSVGLQTNAVVVTETSFSLVRALVWSVTIWLEYIKFPYSIICS